MNQSFYIQFTPIIIIPAFSLSSIPFKSSVPIIIMNIQYSTHRKVFQAKLRKTPFYQLYQAEDDLITQLITLIDSLFAPLTWILEETLYRRVQKEDKGWIKIDFLHRNQRFQSIFKKFDIPSHSRRKKNFINKAIQKSLIKRKKNLIKRRKYLRINQEVKKVLYLELKSCQQKLNNNINSQSIVQNMMSQSVLTSLIRKQLTEIINTRKEQQNPDKMQIEGVDKKNFDFQAIMSEIVFEGSLLKDSENVQSNNWIQPHANSANESKVRNEVVYRWCFIYFPSLQQHQVHKIFQYLLNSISSQRETQKIQLQNDMKNLYISQESINKDQNHKSKQINIFPLQEMISLFYPKYNQVCEQIGYSRVDYRKQVLKVREKQREKQKVRLLQSRYIDDKIDLVTNYHVKLQVQKQKRAYWQKRNKMIEEKIRKRQQKRKNRLKKSEEPQKKKDLTEKLKQLFHIDQPKQLKPDKKPSNIHLEPMSQNSMNGHHMKHQLKQDSVSAQINNNGPGFKIILPNYNQSEPNQPEANSEQVEKLEIEQNKIQIPNFNELYDSQNDFDSDDINSSGEEFQMPKKKKRNSSSQTKKHKKIVKHNLNTFSKPKPQNPKNQASKNQKDSLNQHPSRNGPSDNHSNKKSQSPNTSYNLRHKSPSQGSYLKMAGYAYEDEEHRKNQKKYIYEDVQDEQHQQSSGRNMRPRRS